VPPNWQHGQHDRRNVHRSGRASSFLLAPDAALLHACNWQWWDARWEQVKHLPCDKWTTRSGAS
jgi:hypothetical protein